MQYHVCHRVDNIHPEVFHAWSLFPEKAREACTEQLLPPASLLELRRYVSSHPLRSIADVAKMGASVVEEELKWQELVELQNRLKKNSSKDRRLRGDDTAKNSLGSLKRDAAGKKLEEMRREYQAAVARVTVASTGEAAPAKAQEGSQFKVASTLLRLSPLARVHIKNSTSSKLDYILNEVCPLPQDLLAIYLY